MISLPLAERLTSPLLAELPTNPLLVGLPISPLLMALATSPLLAVRLAEQATSKKRPTGAFPSGQMK